MGSPSWSLAVCVCVDALKAGSAEWSADTGRRHGCGGGSGARWGTAPIPDRIHREDTCRTFSATHNVTHLEVNISINVVSQRAGWYIEYSRWFWWHFCQVQLHYCDQTISINKSDKNCHSYIKILYIQANIAVYYYVLYCCM